ncbi:MAG: retropepsin-like aspartic protease [Cyanobacteria bacterium P01_A01_bin.135]
MKGYRSLIAAALLMGCATDPSPQAVVPAAPPAEPARPPAETASPTSPATPAPSPYPAAIDRASAAYTLSQSARSNDDWQLVASRWQQAIALLESVPESDPNYADATAKLADYRQSLADAQAQANVPIPEVTPGRVVRVSPGGQSDDLASSATSEAEGEGGKSIDDVTDSPGNVAAAGDRRTYQAPIVRRAGGTPVIQVTFDGGQTYEMIVDTGASGTVITQAMAQALNVEPVGEAEVATASASRVPFKLGYVSSIGVAGAQTQEVLVAIAGPDLSIGLLGQDFFSGYDVTIRQDVVEFAER